MSWTTTADTQLLRSREADAFGEFYDRHAPAVLQFLTRRTACPHTAADLAAETFADALEQRHRYNALRGTPRNWLLGIAANKLRHYLRHGEVSARVTRRLGMRVRWHEDELARVEELIDFADLASVVASRLNELSEPLQEAVKLRVIDEMSYDEVADRLGCTPGAARVRVARALSALSGDPELVLGWAQATDIGEREAAKLRRSS